MLQESGDEKGNPQRNKYHGEVVLPPVYTQPDGTCGSDIEQRVM